MTIDTWRRNIPDYIVASGRKIGISLLSLEEIADVTDSMRIRIGERELRITYPGIREGTMTIGRNNYIGITQLRRPPITNVGSGRSKVVQINDAIRWWVPPRSNFPACKWGGHYYHTTIPPDGIVGFMEFPLRPVDRQWINSRTGYSGVQPHIVREDLEYAYSLFHDPEEWNWKYLGDMEALAVDDSFLCYLLSKMRWISRESTEDDEIQRSMDQFWTGNPQIQWVDPNMSDIAMVAMGEKVHFPVGMWDKLEDSLPDPSWVGLLDSLTTPQSEKAGSIISLTSCAVVRNGRIEWRIE